MESVHVIYQPKQKIMQSFYCSNFKYFSEATQVKLPLKNIYPVSNPVKIDIGIMEIQYIWYRKKMYFGETFIIYVCNFYIHF
jgi:hypothetical protein